MREEWVSRYGEETLINYATLGRTSSSDIYQVFGGENSVPVCGVIYPRPLMRARLDKVKARTSYYEDYFLLLTALSAPKICIEQISRLCCGISVRGADNSVTEEDRSIWNISLATVLGEIQANPDLAIGVAWDVANRKRIKFQNELQWLVAGESLGQIIEGALTFAPVSTVSPQADEDIRGYVDRVELEGEELVVAGWAADLAVGGTVEQIAITLGTSILCAVPTHVERSDVALALHLPVSLRCGFHVRIRARHGWAFVAFPEIYALARGQAVKLLPSGEYGRSLLEAIDITGRPFTPDSFDEQYYLAQNEDVRVAVRSGIISSGFAHWVAYGNKEGRKARFHGARPTAAELAEISRRLTDGHDQSLKVTQDSKQEDGQLIQRLEGKCAKLSPPYKSILRPLLRLFKSYLAPKNETS
jgi:hypothetical protein